MRARVCVCVGVCVTRLTPAAREIAARDDRDEIPLFDVVPAARERIRVGRSAQPFYFARNISARLVSIAMVRAAIVQQPRYIRDI